MASKIQVEPDQLQDNILAACYNGAIPLARRHQVCWLLTHILPRTLKEESKILDLAHISLSNIDLILWLLINNELTHGHERILNCTDRTKNQVRIGYGIIVPAECKPTSISMFQRSQLLSFGWMSAVPQTAKEEPKTTG
jgi:hypothetical protein